MTRLLTALCALLLVASPVGAQTWTKPSLAPSPVYQPYLDGNPALAPGTPGAAVSVAPRPVTLSARIFRSYSGVWCGGGKCISMGGGHAGHPGNDIDVYDHATNTWTIPFPSETPPAYIFTTVVANYPAGGTTLTPASIRGFEVNRRAFVENAEKTILLVTAITVLTRTPPPESAPLTGTLTVSVLSNPGAASAGTVISSANGAWRGINGGGVATQAISETGRPLVHHTYDTADWDTKRNRLLFPAGSGFGAYSLDGTWTRLAGKHLKDPVTGAATNNVTGGSGITTVYDEPTDSVFIFVSDSANGAARGVYRYFFNPDGTIKEKLYLHAWPSLANWSFATKTIMATHGPDRTAYILFRPTTQTTNTPPNRLFTYSWNSSPTPASVVWDQTLVPGQLAYDQINWDRWARRDKTGELYFPVVQTEDHESGFWIKSEATNVWTFKAVPGAPNIARWTFAYDKQTDRFFGFTVGNLYCGLGACGGPATPWTLSFDAPPPPPPVTIDAFTVTPAAVVAGQPVVVTWATSNTTAVTLNGAVVAPDGSQTLTPLTTTDYDLLAGGVSRRLTVTVTPAPTIESFTATPPASYVGRPVVLTWATANATSVTLNGAAVGPSGTQTVSPLVTTHYDLLADGVSKRLTVTVTEDPLQFSIGGKQYRLELVP